MRIEFHVTGSDRKALVTAMAEILDVKAKYMGMPSMNYEVDYFTVTKDGTVEFDDRADSEEIEGLLEFLAERGFIAGNADTSEEVPADTDSAEYSEPVGLTVEVPLDGPAVGNLTKLLEAKGWLIRRALAVDSLPIEVTDNRVKFPWFAYCGADECKAYTHFISALCELAANAKRVTAKEKETDNDKYAFRCFLLRLGFIGSEYKTERKILLRNLTGSSAFRNGGSANEVSE